MLIDGSLQFGDLRALLKVPGRRAVDPRPADRPDRRVGPRRTSSGATRRASTSCSPRRGSRWPRWSRARDLDKILSLLRRVYGSIVIDMSAALNDINLAFLDRATRSSRSSPTTRRRSTTRSRWPTRSGSIGYPATKVRYLVNRADSPGGIDPSDLERALGRVPEHRVVSDGMLVVQSNNEGVPFVLANPAAPISQDIDRIAAELLAAHGIVRPAAAGRR